MSLAQAVVTTGNLNTLNWIPSKMGRSLAFNQAGPMSPLQTRMVYLKQSSPQSVTRLFT